MKTILVQYELRGEVSVAEVETQIRAFVSAIADLGIGVRYTSYRSQSDPRRYVHVGEIPDEHALGTLQRAAFFKPFAEFLRGVTVKPPSANWVDQVASARPE